MAYLTQLAMWTLLREIHQEIRKMSGALDTALASINTSLTAATDSTTKLTTDVEALIAKQQSGGSLTPAETAALATLQSNMDAHKAAVDALDTAVNAASNPPSPAPAA
jgi:uncharacterized protein (DUF2141 family)